MSSITVPSPLLPEVVEREEKMVSLCLLLHRYTCLLWLILQHHAVSRVLDLWSERFLISYPALPRWPGSAARLPLSFKAHRRGTTCNCIHTNHGYAHSYVCATIYVHMGWSHIQYMYLCGCVWACVHVACITIWQTGYELCIFYYVTCKKFNINCYYKRRSKCTVFPVEPFMWQKAGLILWCVVIKNRKYEHECRAPAKCPRAERGSSNETVA